MPRRGRDAPAAHGSRALAICRWQGPDRRGRRGHDDEAAIRPWVQSVPVDIGPRRPRRRGWSWATAASTRIRKPRASSDSETGSDPRSAPVSNSNPHDTSLLSAPSGRAAETRTPRPARSSPSGMGRCAGHPHVCVTAAGRFRSPTSCRRCPPIRDCGRPQECRWGVRVYSWGWGCSVPMVSCPSREASRRLWARVFFRVGVEGGPAHPGSVFG